MSTGLYPGFTTFNIGIAGGLIFFVLAVNEKITQAYHELSDLRVHLERKVEQKTEEIKLKNTELESSLIQLKRTQADLIQSEKLASLGTMAAGIAHEINNAINFINGGIPVLDKLIVGITDSKMREKGSLLLGSMKNGVNIVVKIVSSLRNYTAKADIEFKKIKLREVVESVVVIIKSKLGDDIHLELDIDPELVIDGNLVGIHQIFMNLITNAIDAMPNGGNLKISAHQAQDQCMILVQDTGQGIPRDIVSKIFDPFFTTKDVGSGTGLGLHIVRSEINRHLGTIGVDSSIGIGTTFSIQIPISHMMKEAA